MADEMIYCLSHDSLERYKVGGQGELSLVKKENQGNREIFRPVIVTSSTETQQAKLMLYDHLGRCNERLALQ